MKDRNPAPPPFAVGYSFPIIFVEDNILVLIVSFLVKGQLILCMWTNSGALCPIPLVYNPVSK